MTTATYNQSDWVNTRVRDRQSRSLAQTVVFVSLCLVAAIILVNAMGSSLASSFGDAASALG